MPVRVKKQFCSLSKFTNVSILYIFSYRSQIGIMITVEGDFRNPNPFRVFTRALCSICRQNFIGIRVGHVNRFPRELWGYQYHTHNIHRSSRIRNPCSDCFESESCAIAQHSPARSNRWLSDERSHLFLPPFCINHPPSPIWLRFTLQKTVLQLYALKIDQKDIFS